MFDYNNEETLDSWCIRTNKCKSNIRVLKKKKRFRGMKCTFIPEQIAGRDSLRKLCEHVASARLYPLTVVLICSLTETESTDCGLGSNSVTKFHSKFG